MPHINRIRVNNVRYNFGTQFFDDFVMRFDGRNVLYDLANGGGKSVLLLLLLQNLIPNCTLDEKQPVEKLFRGENGSTVIHSLVEWKLDDHMVKDDYRYMLTGFCARKAKEEDQQPDGRDAAAIEYFNYVIFYRQYNDNDIINLPLTDGKQRITYPGLKNYLKNLGRQDYQLKVQVFERKGEYQRFISRYGLYESEWEIIRGINKTEGHVRAYFENNYRTTRKVVENLLIEEIIHKAFLARTSADDQESQEGETARMADTLYEIKDQLSELTKRQDELKNYERQQSVLKALGERIRTLDDMYRQEAELESDMAKTYQTVLLNGKVADRNLAVARKENELAQSRLSDLARKQETVRIQSGRTRLQGLDELSEKNRQELKALQEKCALIREDLNLRESMNDYMDFLEEQKKYEAASQAVGHARSDDEELFLLLRQYAGCWHERLETRLKQITGQVLEKRQKIRVNEAKIKEAAVSERELDKTLAVLEHQIEDETLREEALGREFAQIRDEAGILLVEEAGKLIRRADAQIAKAGKTADESRARLEKIAGEQEKAAVRALQIDPELAEVRYEIADLKAFAQDFKAAAAKIEKLEEIYHVTGSEMLASQVRERYRRTVFEMESGRERLLEIEKQLAQLQSGSPMPAPADAQKLIAYIRSCHGLTCIYGAEYLQGLKKEERKEILTRLPMLPYAVILSEGFKKLSEDECLNEKNFGTHAIPVIGLETVVSDRQPCDMDHILFAGRGQRYFTDEKMTEAEISQLTSEAEELKGRLLRMEDQTETYEQDLDDIKYYFEHYMAVKAQKEKALEAALTSEKQLENEKEVLKAGQASAKAEAASAQSELEKAEKEIASLEAEKEVLIRLNALSDELSEVNAQKITDKKNRDEIRRKISGLLEEQERLSKENQQLEEAVSLQLTQSRDLNQDWTSRWQIYAGGETPDPSGEILQMTDEQLQASFDGVRQAYEKEHFDLDDKKQLIESLSRSMGRLTKSITDRNQDIERLERMNREGSLVVTDETVLAELRAQVSEAARQAEDAEKKIRILEAERNQLCGSVNQAVSAVQEKYGTLKEVDLHNQTYEDYIRDISKLMDETAAGIAAGERRVQLLTKENYYLEGLRRDLERMLKLYHVPADLTKETYGNNVNLKQKYEDLTARHEQLQRQHYLRREAFEKDKNRTVEALNELGAQELAREIREQVSLPDSAGAAGEIITGIEETIDLISLERDRVTKNMADLVTVKESFENQCLQICMNIRSELEKLPKMSVISLEGEKVQMLGLSVPYIKETFYREQMSGYIDRIIEGLEGFRTQDEKLKFIRQQLEWRHLFAVIVTDMNAIRLTLYKRERIREQSRYLRYEEAVGSTGQSQGIYIQFLIAIIHYISSINAGTAAKDNLKKVIFIDNPFGAAKDIYIWEPIFALLKTNNVQLVVPARGATPAITGMFDVNYCLGQKLMGQGQQTIVVDYHSNIVIEDVEYVKIDYEQQVFDFV